MDVSPDQAVDVENLLVRVLDKLAALHTPSVDENFVDVLEQYDMTQVKNGINVPFLPLNPGNKKFLAIPGMKDAGRGEFDTAVTKYEKTFDEHTHKAIGLIDRLFM